MGVSGLWAVQLLGGCSAAPSPRSGVEARGSSNPQASTRNHQALRIRPSCGHLSTIFCLKRPGPSFACCLLEGSFPMCVLAAAGIVQVELALWRGCTSDGLLSSRAGLQVRVQMRHCSCPRVHPIQCIFPKPSLTGQLHHPANPVLLQIFGRQLTMAGWIQPP